MKALSTGSSLLNLACSDSPYGGFLPGKYYFLVGDSQSGKTFLSMTCFAEAMRTPGFKDYELIYDNVEDGCLMDIDSLFGEAVADRVRPPAVAKDGTPIYSDTVEAFYFNVAEAARAGKPFIYILDSMDALDDDASLKKFEQGRKAFIRKRGVDEDGDGQPEEKIAGSYGTGKAKKNSEGIRKALKGLRETGSILIVISQTRDNLSGYGGKTRAGGRALRFYATLEIWSSTVEHLKRQVGEKKREVGIRVALEVRKNRITGKLHKVEVDIYPSYGIDDLGSMIDFLVEEGHWKLVKQTIHAKDLGLTGTREKIIRVVEHKRWESTVQAACGECWQRIEEACAVRRRPRYAEPTSEEGKE